MAARLDEQVALLRDLRPHPAPRPGHVGQRPEHVERGEDRGHAVEGGAVLGREEPQEFEQFDLLWRVLYSRVKQSRGLEVW